MISNYSDDYNSSTRRPDWHSDGCAQECHDGETNVVRWSPSGKLLATGGSDRKLKLWMLYQGRVELKSTLAGAAAAILDISFDPNVRLRTNTYNVYKCDGLYPSLVSPVRY